MLLHHFYLGLDQDSTQSLNNSFEGSFFYTLNEGMKILDNITETISLVAKVQPLREEHNLRQEDIPAAEPLALLDLALGPSPEPQVPKEEETRPLEPLLKFEDDIFEDFRNTSNHYHIRKPLVPTSPLDPLETTILRENMKELTSIMTSEWSQELEL